MNDQLTAPAKVPKTSRLAVITGAILSTGMAFAVSAILFFAWIAEEVFEGESTTFDNTIREFIHKFAADRLTAMMQVFSFLGSTVFISTASLLLVLLFIFKRQSRAAVLLAIVMIGAIILNYTLKINFGRMRPVPYFDTPLPDSFSFPSGHSLFSACFYGISTWLLLSRAAGGYLKLTISVAAGLIILFVGVSRIYLGVHYPTDVIAGYVAAFVWLTSVTWTNGVIAAERPPPRK